VYDLLQPSKAHWNTDFLAWASPGPSASAATSPKFAGLGTPTTLGLALLGLYDGDDAAMVASARAVATSVAADAAAMAAAMSSGRETVVRVACDADEDDRARVDASVRPPPTSTTSSSSSASSSSSFKGVAAAAAAAVRFVLARPFSGCRIVAATAASAVVVFVALGFPAAAVVAGADKGADGDASVLPCTPEASTSKSMPELVQVTATGEHTCAKMAAFS